MTCLVVLLTCVVTCTVVLLICVVTDFGGILQSNSENITSSDTFRIDVSRVNVPVGKGRVRPGLYNSFEEEC